MKKAILLILFLPLLVSAVTECKRFATIPDDIPCIQPSTYNPGDCSAYDLNLYNDSLDLVYTVQWYDYAPYCAVNITNITTPGTYCYNSSLETGCITLEREDNMLSIILVQLALITFFIIVGLPYKFGFLKFTAWGMALLEIVMMVWMVYIVESGESISNLLYINSYMVLVLGGVLGFISIFMVMVRLMTKDKPLEDDGYTKFVFNQK